MKKALNYYFLGIVIFLIGFGILFLATLSAPASLQAFGNTNYYLFHQLLALGIGLILGFIAFKVPLNFIKKIAPVILIGNIILLIIVFLPAVGIKIWGAKRWINIAGMSLQPSEFFKITVIVYLSAWLSSKFPEQARGSWTLSFKKGYHHAIKIFLPFLILLGITTVFLYFQKDASTLAIITLSLLAVYFAAGTPVWHTMATVLGGISFGLLLIKLEPYRMQRFLVFLHPETDPLGSGFQIKQALLALGSGGIFGKGLGMSTQKFGFLPQSMSDSIFAILGEETGIIGCSILVLLFVAFFWNSIRIAIGSQDKFAKLTAVGLTTWILLQAFMNIASSVGIFPITGVPLPFFSYGGSHIIAEMIAVGLLLNISRHS